MFYSIIMTTGTVLRAGACCWRQKLHTQCVSLSPICLHAMLPQKHVQKKCTSALQKSYEQINQGFMKATCQVDLTKTNTVVLQRTSCRSVKTDLTPHYMFVALMLISLHLHYNQQFSFQTFTVCRPWQLFTLIMLVNLDIFPKYEDITEVIFTLHDLYKCVTEENEGCCPSSLKLIKFPFYIVHQFFHSATSSRLSASSFASNYLFW